MGPGHHPYPIGFPGIEVKYVDRWEPDENRALFPELGDEAPFPRPDIVSNLDVDRLKPLEDRSQDFVIASHVLEHMADPLGLLGEIYRVVRPGGTALILLPDRRLTFDSKRPATPLDHLVVEYEAQVTEVDDDHIVDFIRLTGTDDYEAYLAMSDAEKAEHIEFHRRRSIHAHCWKEDEFLEVILHAIEHLDQEWEFLDGVLSEDEGPEGFEFGYVLRRSDVPDIPAAERRQRFADTWNLWLARRAQLQSRLSTPATAPVDDAPPPPEAPRPLHRRVGGRLKRTVRVALTGQP